MYKDIKLVDIFIDKNKDTLTLYRYIEDEIAMINDSMNNIFINGIKNTHEITFSNERASAIEQMKPLIDALKKQNRVVVNMVDELIRNDDNKTSKFHTIATTTYSVLMNELCKTMDRLNDAMEKIKYYMVGYSVSDIRDAKNTLAQIYSTAKRYSYVDLHTIILVVYQTYEKFIFDFVDIEYFKEPETPDFAALLKDFLVSYRNLLSNIRNGLSIQIRIPDEDSDNKEN